MDDGVERNHPGQGSIGKGQRQQVSLLKRDARVPLAEPVAGSTAGADPVAAPAKASDPDPVPRRTVLPDVPVPETLVERLRDEMTFETIITVAAIQEIATGATEKVIIPAAARI